MSRRTMGRVGLWAAAGGCIVLATILSLSPTAQGDKSRTAHTAERDKDSFDAELYESISARLVADETDLIAAMFLDYLGVYPLIPPVQEFSLTFDMGTIPYNAGTFPTARLLTELTPEVDAKPRTGIFLWALELGFPVWSPGGLRRGAAGARRAPEAAGWYGFWKADAMRHARIKAEGVGNLHPWPDDIRRCLSPPRMRRGSSQIVGIGVDLDAVELLGADHGQERAKAVVVSEEDGFLLQVFEAQQSDIEKIA